MQRLCLARRIAVDGWRTLILRRIELFEPQEEGDQTA
jgi:hypothetical protein